MTGQIPVPAPVGGQIVERLVGPGQLLQAGSTQCFTISDMSTVWVLANIYQADLANGGSLQGEVKLAMCSMSRDPRCELTPAQIMQPVQVGDEPPVVPGLGDGVVTGNDLQRSSGSGARGLTDYGRRILSSSSRQAHHDIPRWGRYAGIASLGGNPWTMLNSSSTLLITRNGQDFESPKSG